jgi:hypothetical protein
VPGSAGIGRWRRFAFPADELAPRNLLTFFTLFREFVEVGTIRKLFGRDYDHDTSNSSWKALRVVAGLF